MNEAMKTIKWIIEPLDGHEMKKLEGVAVRLKQSDGEGHAVGRMLERMLEVMEEAWDERNNEDSECG